MVMPRKYHSEEEVMAARRERQHVRAMKREIATIENLLWAAGVEDKSIAEELHKQGFRVRRV